MTLTIRARITLATAIPLGIALLLGTVAVAAVYSHGREREVERTTRAEAELLARLVADGQIPRVLPLPAGSTLLAQVLDQDGNVIAASPTASQIQSLTVAGATPDVPLHLNRKRVGRDTVVVAAPLTDVRRAVHALAVVLTIVVPLLLLATTTVVWWVTGLILKPVGRLRAAAQQLATSDVEELLPVPDRDDELTRLATTFNQLLRTVRDRAAREREFVADAAHELRTPIASLAVQLDVAEAHPSRGAVRLPDLRAEVTRLSQLVEDLLTLARLDAGQSPLSAVVDLTAISGARGEPVWVRGDESSLRRLVANLLANAHRFGDVVRLSCRREVDVAVLDVDDNGPGIPPADRERVFERWVRLDDGRARSDGGAGLGLSLSRQIAQAHGGHLEILDSPFGGARLRLTLPTAPSEPERGAQ